MEKINGVSLGDMFVAPEDNKAKRISTVVDFVERKSVVTGKTIDFECWAEYEFMGKKCQRQVAFATAVRYRVANTNQIAIKS
jgi:hypothetical protein